MSSRSAAASRGPHPGCSALWSRVSTGLRGGAAQARGSRRRRSSLDREGAAWTGAWVGTRPAGCSSLCARAAVLAVRGRAAYCVRGSSEARPRQRCGAERGTGSAPAVGGEQRLSRNDGLCVQSARCASAGSARLQPPICVWGGQQAERSVPEAPGPSRTGPLRHQPVFTQRCFSRRWNSEAAPPPGVPPQGTEVSAKGGRRGSQLCSRRRLAPTFPWSGPHWVSSLHPRVFWDLLWPSCGRLGPGIESQRVEGVSGFRTSWFLCFPPHEGSSCRDCSIYSPS